MLVNTPVSLGELVDKLSILKVKKENITDEKKLIEVNKELDILELNLIKHVTKEEIDNYLNELIDINSKLWRIEDDIRDCERNKQFDENVYLLAEHVYLFEQKVNSFDGSANVFDKQKYWLIEGSDRCPSK